MYQGRKLDYNKFLQRVKGNTDSLEYAFAYGTESPLPGFVTCLKKYGYDVTFKTPKPKENRANTNVELVLDIIRVMDRVDTVIIGSSDSDLLPLIKFLQERRVKCIVFACNVCPAVRHAAYSVHEITEDLLENKEKEQCELSDGTVSSLPIAL